MKISKTTIALIVSGGVAFNLAMKAGQEGYETNPCYTCCDVVITRQPFLDFEYWSEVSIMLFVLSFAFIIAAFRFMFSENNKIEIPRITPQD